jgi:hypothetical protein
MVRNAPRSNEPFLLLGSGYRWSHSLSASLSVSAHLKAYKSEHQAEKCLDAAGNTGPPINRERVDL